MKKVVLLWPLMLLGLASLACSYPGLRPTALRTTTPSTGPTSATQASPQSSLTGVSTGGSPAASSSPTQASSNGLKTGETAVKPPQSQRAEIRPAEMRPSLTRISALTGMQVLDKNGALLGTTSDWIVNTCETYLVYFLLAPSSALQAPAGSQIIIPYEAVSINSGVLDAQSKSIQLQLPASQLAGVPGLPEAQALVPTDWEAAVRDFWLQHLRLSGLTTGCKVPASGGGTVETHKVARASQILGAELRDGLNNLLGKVEEIILEPESGKVSFFVIRRASDHALVLAPLRVVNIPNEALQQGGKFSLVLLVNSGLLNDAPAIGSIDAAAEAQARGYWNK